MLTLTIEKGPPGGEQARTVYRTGATIGRGEVNDWVLADPERHLSKRHCVIGYENGRYSLTDTSTNGVFLNGAAQPVGRGNNVPLQDGDRIQIGEYVIRATVAPDVEPAPARAPGASPADTFAAKLAGEVGRPEDEKDPFGLGRVPPAAAAARPAVPPLPAPEADDGLDFLPADRAIGPAPVARPEPPVPEVTPLDDLDDDPIFGKPTRPPASPRPGAEPDHVPSPQQNFRPPRTVETPPAAGGAIPEDWDLGPGEPTASPSRPEPTAIPEILPDADLEIAPPPTPAEAPPSLTETLLRPPTVAPTSTPTPPTPATPAPATSTPAADGGRGGAEAFLAAAGVDTAGLTDEQVAAMMRVAGECFRAMVAGMRGILMARASLKNEFRVERTMIRPADNNPLKFSPSPEEALRALLHPPARGYMPGPAAVQEGFRDLEAHQLATLAGMQVALTALLEQFDPQNLKQRLEQHSLLGSIVPAMRKAKYWEIYEALFGKVAQEAQDSFHGVYGRAFAKAYEEQVKKL